MHPYSTHDQPFTFEDYRAHLAGAWPAVFLLADGAHLCRECAREITESRAATCRYLCSEDLAIEDEQWAVIGVQRPESDPEYTCAHCGQSPEVSTVKNQPSCCSFHRDGGELAVSCHHRWPV